MSRRARLLSAATATAAAGLLLLGCGARTSIAIDGTGDGGGGGTSSATSSAPATSTGTGTISCEEEAFGGPSTQGGQRLEVAGDHVYWTTVSGRLARAQLGGGAVETLAEGLTDVGDLAIDGDRVVVGASGGLLAVPTTGGALEVLAPRVPGIVTLAVDASGIYWMAGGGGIAGYAIERLARDGGREVLLTGIDYGIGLTLNEDDVIFTAGALPGFVAVDVIASFPKDGGPITVLAEERPGPTNVFVRGGDLYWTEQFDALSGPVGVARLRAGASAPELLLVAPEGALPILAAASDTDLVLTALDVSRGALLLRTPIEGGATEVLAEQSGFFLEPALTPERVVVTVQPPVDDPDAVGEAEVAVRCLR